MSRSKYLNQKPEDPAKPYVFISYARNDAPEDTLAAQQIEDALVAAGIHCFRDVHIPKADDWDLAIESALEECNKMVLVASSRSMDKARVEVPDDWIPFYRKSKTVFLFAIEMLDLPARFVKLNNIDATIDREQALKELLEEIQSGTNRKLRGGESSALDTYRQSRVDFLTQPKYQIDKLFVTLSALHDSGENRRDRWFCINQFCATNLRKFLETARFKRARLERTTVAYPVFVLLGKPGSGKSTILRRLELDHCLDRNTERDGEITFQVQLNDYQSNDANHLISPMEWLSNQWAEMHPELESLEFYLEQGRVLLLLDALNEMPITKKASYEDLVGFWRIFAQTWAKKSNQIIFTCRSLNNSIRLNSEALPVSHLIVEPMDEDQVHAFIQSNAPTYLNLIEKHLKDPRQFEFYQSPYFLRLLCQALEYDERVPEGQAALFTVFIRSLLNREMERPNTIFNTGNLLEKYDRCRLSENKWDGPFDLPEMGLLIGQLSQLAYKMQSDPPDGAANQVQISYQRARGLLDHQSPDEVIEAGLALGILDRYGSNQITFFHQLLQEYFAARRLANHPKPALAYQEWRREQVTPRYEEVIIGKKIWEPVPPLPPNAWEQTFLMAVPMADDPVEFIRNLIPHHLPLAARCADSGELSRVDEKQREALRIELRDQLLRRMRDPEADLRARLAAGEALGELGHPEFERHSGKFGDFLLPPFEPVPAGIYPFGKENRPVELAGFLMGRYPVTNAEFALFIAAGGYCNAKWWDTDEARDWLKERFSPVPYFWYDTHFNNPAQPVVGVTWYEARAYCNWLTASFGSLSSQVSTGGGEDRIVRLPTIPEFEAAARGREGWLYPHENDFDPRLCNTMESGIGRPSPVGLFENRSPLGIYDLSGNVSEWCLNDELMERLEDPTRIELGGYLDRLVGGGAWTHGQGSTRVVSWSRYSPYLGHDNIGFRVVSVVRPPS